MAVIPQEYKNLLHTTALAHIATIGPKGEPQSTPVWFDWDGTNIRFSQTKGPPLNNSVIHAPYGTL